MFFSLVATAFAATVAANSPCDAPESLWYGPALRQHIEMVLSSFTPCVHDCYAKNIKADLLPYRATGIRREEFKEACAMYSVIRYQIVDHRVYRQEECRFEARCQGIEYFLTRLAVRLPDMDFCINVRDQPLVRKPAKPVPVFSFSKYDRFLDIMYPAWTFWQGGPALWPLEPTGIGRWDIKRELISEKAAKWPWEAKEKRAFFRGSRTSEERDPIVLLSRAKPELADAGYIKNQAYKGPQDLLHGPEANLVAVEDHCQFAFLFNFRGVAASFRHKHLFMCGSLVFHVGDEWEEFYYSEIEPWYHYVPVPVHMKDVEKLIQFFKDNDDLAQEIAANGAKFVRDHLRMEDVDNYWFDLLMAYSDLQQWDTERDDFDMPKHIAYIPPSPQPRKIKK